MVSFGDGNRDFLLKFGEFLNMNKVSGVQSVIPTKDHLFYPLQLWGIVKSEPLDISRQYMTLRKMYGLSLSQKVEHKEFATSAVMKV
jgi:hypothetical protein